MQHCAAEAVPVALDHGNEVGGGRGDGVDVVLPGGLLDGEAQGHLVGEGTPRSTQRPPTAIPELIDRNCPTIVAGVRRWFGFPNPVNETSARLVASGVIAQAAAFLLVRQWWVLVPLAYGFVARVLAGPRFSPLGQVVTRFVTPRIHAEHRFVAGPPKRFAQGMGLAFSVGALLAWGLGSPTTAYALIGALIVAATLEAAFAVCLGCMVFGWLMRLGVVPADVCEECNNLNLRFARASS